MSDIVKLRGTVNDLSVIATIICFDDGFHIWDHTWADPKLRGQKKYTDYCVALAPQFNELLGEDGRCSGMMNTASRGNYAAKSKNLVEKYAPIFNRPMTPGQYKEDFYFYIQAKSDDTVYESVPTEHLMRVRAHYHG